MEPGLAKSRTWPRPQTGRQVFECLFEPDYIRFALITPALILVTNLGNLILGHRRHRHLIAAATESGTLMQSHKQKHHTLCRSCIKICHRLQSVEMHTYQDDDKENIAEDCRTRATMRKEGKYTLFLSVTSTSQRMCRGTLATSHMYILAPRLDLALWSSTSVVASSFTPCDAQQARQTSARIRRSSALMLSGSTCWMYLAWNNECTRSTHPTISTLSSL